MGKSQSSQWSIVGSQVLPFQSPWWIVCWEWQILHRLRLAHLGVNHEIWVAQFYCSIRKGSRWVTYCWVLVGVSMDHSPATKFHSSQCWCYERDGRLTYIYLYEGILAVLTLERIQLRNWWSMWKWWRLAAKEYWARIKMNWEPSWTRTWASDLHKESIIDCDRPQKRAKFWFDGPKPEEKWEKI